MSKITTRYVRNCYVNSTYSDFAPVDPDPESASDKSVAAEFDEWLAEVIRAAKEIAYDHGATDMSGEYLGHGIAINPYRKEI